MLIGLVSLIAYCSSGDSQEQPTDEAQSAPSAPMTKVQNATMEFSREIIGPSIYCRRSWQNVIDKGQNPENQNVAASADLFNLTKDAIDECGDAKGTLVRAEVAAILTPKKAELEAAKILFVKSIDSNIAIMREFRRIAQNDVGLAEIAAFRKNMTSGVGDLQQCITQIRDVAEKQGVPKDQLPSLWRGR